MRHISDDLDNVATLRQIDLLWFLVLKIQFNPLKKLNLSYNKI